MQTRRLLSPLALGLALLAGCTSVRTPSLRWTPSTDCQDTAAAVLVNTASTDSLVLCRGRLNRDPFIGIVDDCDCLGSGPWQKVSMYQTLNGSGSYAWVDIRSGDDLPDDAVPYGPPDDGRRRVICRMSIDGTPTIGVAEEPSDDGQPCNCVTTGPEPTRSSEFAVLTANVADDPYPYDLTVPVYGQPNVMVVRSGYHYGFDSSNWKTILPCEYQFDPNLDGPESYMSGAVVAHDDSTWGTIAPNGWGVLPFDYQYLAEWNGTYYAQKDGHAFMLDDNGEIVQRLGDSHLCGLVDLSGYDSDRRERVSDGILFLSPDGTSITMHRLTGNSSRKPDRIVVLYVNGKYGAYDTVKEAWALDPEYDRIEVSDDHYTVYRDGEASTVAR